MYIMCTFIQSVESKTYLLSANVSKLTAQKLVFVAM